MAGISANRPRVLACRPHEQNRSWLTFLQSNGVATLNIPLLHIAPLTSEYHQQAIKSRILHLDNYNTLIFVSQNAVKFAFDWIEDFWPQLPSEQSLLAIGEITAAHIRQRCGALYPGASNRIDFASGAMTSEALLALPALSQVEGKKILVLKGQGGRGLLQNNLQKAGATVEICELYERLMPGNAIETFASTILTKDDIFVVFSGETLVNLHLALAKNSYTDKLTIPLLVPGERVARQAKELGYQNILISKSAAEENMWEALQHIISDKGK